jgi:uncharacterized protein YjbI with pentapeptide repeats
MANPEHLAILKQGEQKWNRWRKAHPEIVPDLSWADLREIFFSVWGNDDEIYDTGLSVEATDLEEELVGIDISHAKLNGAKLDGGVFNWTILSESDLSDVSLAGASINWAHLEKVILRDASIGHANFYNVNLDGADLSGASLVNTAFRECSLRGTCFKGSYIQEVHFRETDLDEVDFGESEMLLCSFSDVDLRNAKGLGKVNHIGPSTIGVDTLTRCGGKIPKAFLRGCGLSENFITHIGTLATWKDEYSSCFISYSSKDQAFAKRLYADLQNKGVRCWFASEDMKIGDRFRIQIDESIRVHEKLLLILSENSVASDWVEKEVETAMEKERESKKTVLCPVRLDDSVNAIMSGWAADVRRTRHIGDFSNWKSHNAYEKGFDRLLRDLKVEGDSSQSD